MIPKRFPKCGFSMYQDRIFHQHLLGYLSAMLLHNDLCVRGSPERERGWGEGYLSFVS